VLVSRLPQAERHSSQESRETSQKNKIEYKSFYFGGSFLLNLRCAMKSLSLGTGLDYFEVVAFATRVVPDARQAILGLVAIVTRLVSGVVSLVSRLGNPVIVSDTWGLGTQPISPMI
jgi:hypothetical protein